jgi:hypothetical protein
MVQATTGSSQTDTASNWATAVLNQGHYPNTAQNQSFLVGWASHENTSASYNPLATTYRTSSSQPLPGNSAGVQQYGSVSEGVGATVATLQNGDYPSINAALASGNPWPANDSGALGNNLSTWSGGGYTQVNAAPAGYNTPALTGGVAQSSAGAGGTAAASSSTTPTGFISGPCDKTKSVISFPSVVGIGGGTLLNQCTAKHIVGGMVILGGGIVTLVGVALLFTGGRNALGNAAQAGVNAAPGGVVVQRVVQRGASKGGVKQGQSGAQRKAAAEDRETDLQTAHAQGIMTGRAQGRQRNGLKMGLNRGSGAAFEEAA